MKLRRKKKDKQDTNKKKQLRIVKLFEKVIRRDTETQNSPKRIFGSLNQVFPKLFGVDRKALWEN